MTSAGSVALVSMLLIMSAGVAHAQVVPLKGGDVHPSREGTLQFFKELREAAEQLRQSSRARYRNCCEAKKPEDSPEAFKHGLITFSQLPSIEDRRTLAGNHVEVLSPVYGTTYRVRVSSRADADTVMAFHLAPRLTAMSMQFRCDPRLISQLDDMADCFGLADAKQDTLNRTVTVYQGVYAEEVRKLFAAYNLEPDQQSDETWFATVPRDTLPELARADIVSWIGLGPPPFKGENDKVRAALNVDSVQCIDTACELPEGLRGTGIQVGIFDLGVDAQHSDFAGRIRRDAREVDRHATHVAGTILGSGVQSAKFNSAGLPNKGRPYQWRGMAPGAELLDIFRGQPNGPNGANAGLHYRYIFEYGMDISNHSYTVNEDGAYDGVNRVRDQLIRGDATLSDRMIVVPARLQVTSAGNERRRYFSLTKQFKNALVVGNWDLKKHEVYKLGSVGPTTDGRIKPDIVAPGVDVVTPAYCQYSLGKGFADCFVHPDFISAHNMYVRATGSSIASAAATGVSALVLEQYMRTYKVDLDRFPPLPSTLRAILIHTARDIEAPLPWFNDSDEVPVHATRGPDFATGWGLADAGAAVKLVSERRMTEGVIERNCEKQSFSFRVPKSAKGNLRVTLAWDDIAADPAVRDQVPRLVNDLDLMLIAPNDAPYYPWQLDQEFYDSKSRKTLETEKLCGSELTVMRKAESPTDGQPRGSTVIPPAGSGPDHLNNVEVIDAPAIPGTWTVIVLAFRLAQGPQRFSLVGQNFSVLEKN